MCSKKYLLVQDKYSFEIDCLSFQQNHSLNIPLISNVSNILMFQQKYYVMAIQQEIKQIYGDLTGVSTCKRFDRNFQILLV